MNRGVVTINCERRIGSINDHIFGSFIEMIPGSIHGGVYDPASPVADEEGFRNDVIEATRAMGVSIVRFPGGCFAPFYHWRDGVGPKETRPKTRYDKVPGTGDPWWSSSNDFGTDEFISWCRKVGAEPFICVNMGSGTAEEARDWVEYCNHPGGSRWADLRIRNGHPEPFNVKYWALGNEISCDWEFGYADSAEDYIKRYNVTDAILVAAYFNIFIRNADVATLSNSAQLVNVLPAMITEPGGRKFFRQTTSHVQEMFLANRGKIAVDTWQDAPTYPGEFFPEVPVLDCSASFDPKQNELAINIVNRDPRKRIAVDLQVRDRRIRRLAGTVFGREKLTDTNDFDKPSRLVPSPLKLARKTSLSLPPASIAVCVAKVA